MHSLMKGSITPDMEGTVLLSSSLTHLDVISATIRLFELYDLIISKYLRFVNCYNTIYEITGVE